MIYTLLAQQPTGLGTYRPPVDTFQPGPLVNPGTTVIAFEKLFSNIVGVMTVVGGVLFMLFFFFAAAQWALAGSDEGKVEQAKQQMTYAAIGLVIIVLSYGIIAIIGQLVGLDILSPGETILQLRP